MDCFSNVVSQLALKVSHSDIYVTSYLKNRNINSFLIIPVVKEEEEHAISQLKSDNSLLSKSPAVHESVKSSISPYLANILNLCLNQGYFPKN